MPERQEKPRVDLRQVITSPQFCIGLSALITNTRNSCLETLSQAFIEPQSGGVLYNPTIQVGGRDNVGNTDIAKRDELEFQRVIGLVKGGQIGYMKEATKPYKAHYPKAPDVRFLPRNANPNDYPLLIDAHTHPADPEMPSTDDLIDLNRIRVSNKKITQTEINPVSAIISVPLYRGVEEFPVLFIQESEKELLSEEQIKRIPEGPNWQRARHSNPHYNQVQALFNKSTGRIEILSQPFTLSV